LTFFLAAYFKDLVCVDRLLITTVRTRSGNMLAAGPIAFDFCFAKSANFIAVLAGLILRAVFAILVLQAWWRYHQRHAQANVPRMGAAGRFVKSCNG